MTELEKLNELQDAMERLESKVVMGLKKMLSIDDVCLLTGLAKSYIYQLTSEKKIPYYKPNGRLIYFDRSEVEAWLRQNRQGTQSEAEQKAVNYIARANEGV